MNAISTDSLTKVYPTQIGKKPARALDSVSLRVGEGEVFGFLGRNGAGKTTTIKILCSLLKASSGEARVFDKPARTKDARRMIGYLPENPYFYEYLTPRETIEFYGRLHGLNALGRNRDWEKLAELLDLGSIAKQRVRSFSKGMRQRLGFAVALVGDPPLLILDEPMSGLDPLGRRAIRDLILNLSNSGKTIFFSSHVLGDVEQICDQAAILVSGKLSSQGRIDALLTREILHVEVIVEGLAAAIVNELASEIVSTRQSEAGTYLVLRNMEAANAVAKKVIEHGGRLVEFTPIRQSLEDYFVDQQSLTHSRGLVG